jgi:hydroxypyruvate isomerase
MRSWFARIAHLRRVDKPSSNEACSGEINCPFLFDFIDRQGFDRWIGCEYKSAAAPRDHLGVAQTVSAPGSAVAQHKRRDRT